MKASQYKEYKGIRKKSLRDNMTDIKVALTDLGEIATRELVKEHKPYGWKENIFIKGLNKIRTMFRKNKSKRKKIFNIPIAENKNK